MKFRHSALLVVILALPVMAGGERIHDRDTSTSLSASGERNAKSPAFAAGQIVTLDANGKVNPGAPQTSELTRALGDALSTSSEGLVEVKSAGGGYMVDLQGRFQNAMTITVDENGNRISAPCVSGSPEDAKTAPEVK